jgi:hypothetical protein
MKPEDFEKNSLTTFASMLELLNRVVRFGKNLKLEFARKPVADIVLEAVRKQIEIEYSER